MSRRTASSRLAIIPLAAAVLLVASACFRVDVSVTVNDDGSGTVSLLSAINVETLKSVAGSLGGDTTAPKVDDVDRSKLPPGSKVESYKDGPYEGVRVTFPFKEGDDLGKLLQGASPGNDSGDTASAGASFDSFVLEREGDGWRFEAIVKPSAGNSSGEQALSPEAMKQFFKDASFTVRLALPGSVTSHNADHVDGSKLTWDIDFLATQPRTLSAHSRPGGGDDDFPVWPVVIGGAVVLVLLAGAGAAIVYRRRQHPSGPAPASDEVPAPVGDESPPA